MISLGLHRTTSDGRVLVSSSPAASSEASSLSSAISGGVVAAGSGTAFERALHDGVDAVRADALMVLAVLQNGAERRVHGGVIERAAFQGEQRLGPVDRLGDTGRL